MITFVCPHCKHNLQIPEKYLGQSGKCNRCGGKISIVMQTPFVSAIPHASGIFRSFKQKGEQLIDAARKGDEPAVARLLSEGASANAKDDLGMTPLHAAARGGNLRVTQLLIAAGADVNIKAGDGCTALHWAASAGQMEILRLLAPRVFHIDAKDRDGQTALHLAVRTSHPRNVVMEIVQLLIARGANVNARCNAGLTPLHEAEEFGYPEVADLLRGHGGEK